MADGATTGMPPANESQLLVLLARNRGDVIERVLGVLRRRAPFFSTINVAPSQEPAMMRVTIGFQGTQAIAERTIAQLRKLVDVCSATVIPAAGADSDVLLREFTLIRVACNAQTRREIVELAHLFAARVVDITRTSVTVEVSGSPARIESLLRLLRPFGIREVVRTGQIAMKRDTDPGAEAPEAIAAGE